MEQIIQNYAHDYRMMSMTELELSKLLTQFLKEIQTYQPKARHKLSCDNCSYTEKNIKEVTDELWELIPKDFNYKNIDRKTLYNWLKSRLEYSITQALAEERERVREGLGKMRKEITHPQFALYEKGYNQALQDITKQVKLPPPSKTN